MSHLANSYLEHAAKMKNGRRGWIRTENGFAHTNEADSKAKAEYMIFESERLQAAYLQRLYR